MPHVLLIQCPDQVGLIHTVTSVLLSHRLNIVANDEFVDPEAQLFFMRTEYTGTAATEALTQELRDRLPIGAVVRSVMEAPKKIVMLTGREPHCAGDLLLRQFNRELDLEIQCVVSNHPVLEPLVSRFDVPFFHVPAAGDDRQDQEKRLLEVIQPFQPDYLVLAKYMRILSRDFIENYPGRIINIHHSFLPAFVGAQPYRQAFERGVKIIGATAHFVTETLDDGPIIAQSVLPVTHAHTARSMAQEGKEIEKIVLAQALKLVLEDRVFVSGNKTIIFD